MPESTALAAGAALSRNNRTPNLLHTCAARELAARRARRAFGWTLFLGVLLIGLHLGMGMLEVRRALLHERLLHEQEQLARFPDTLDEQTIAAMGEALFAARCEVKQAALRWLPLGVLLELGHLTPSAIRLTAIDAVFPDPSKSVKDASWTTPAKEGGAVLRLRGRVADDPEQQRTVLAAYALRLEDSRLFVSAEVVRTVADADRTSLSFELKLVSAGLRGAAPLRQQEATP